MPTVSKPMHSASAQHSYTTSGPYRALQLILCSLIFVWALVAGYLWSIGQGSISLFLGASLFTIVGLIQTYSTFTSKLVLSSQGIYYFSYGILYFAPWDRIKFSKRRWLWRNLDELALSSPMPPTEKTMFGRLMMPQSISYIPLQAFGWPSDRLRADIERFGALLVDDSK
jgi:hypothetical protein